MDFSEKRDFQRMVLDCSMEYWLGDETDSSQGKVINLSAKGVLFEASKEVQPGDNIKITLTPVNDITPPMSADTLVTRCDKQSDDVFQIAAQIVQIR